MLDEQVSSAAKANNGKGPVSDSSTDGFELLACVACRSRKLKCDRTKPACTRCLRLKANCTYPESRKKPAFKQRNVKELAERLGSFGPWAWKKVSTASTSSLTHICIAQVEVLLKDAAGKIESIRPNNSSPGAPQEPKGKAARGNVQGDPGLKEHPPLSNGASDPFRSTSPPAGVGMPFEFPDLQPRAANAGATSYELLGFGLFEALPPTEMIEEL